jgi:hypothetical protein
VETSTTACDNAVAEGETVTTADDNAVVEGETVTTACDNAVVEVETATTACDNAVVKGETATTADDNAVVEVETKTTACDNAVVEGTDDNAVTEDEKFMDPEIVWFGAFADPQEAEEKADGDERPRKAPRTCNVPTGELSGYESSYEMPEPEVPAATPTDKHPLSGYSGGINHHVHQPRSVWRPSNILNVNDLSKERTCQPTSLLSRLVDNDQQNQQASSSSRRRIPMCKKTSQVTRQEALDKCIAAHQTRLIATRGAIATRDTIAATPSQRRHRNPRWINAVPTSSRKRTE